MGILNILRSLVRYWWITVAVVLLTCAGVYYVAVYSPKTYETTTSFVLLNPPNPGGDASETNPFLRLADQSSLVALLASVINNDDTHERLVAQGADERYEAGAGSTFGGASLILDIYAPGQSPESALVTAELVGEELDRQLRQLQDAQSVPTKSRITLLELDPSPTAELKASSLLRALVAVVALGGILLVGLVSVAQAIGELRASRRVEPSEEGVGGEGPHPEVAQRSVDPGVRGARVHLPAPESSGG